MCYYLAVYDWPWPTIWSALQTLFTPVAISVAFYTAITHPKRSSERQDLQRLVGYRNIAWFVVRLLRGYRGQPLNGDLVRTLERCHALLTQVSIAEIGAPGLTEAFARIDVASSICLIQAQGNGALHVNDVDEASKELDRIDEYLSEHRLEMLPDGSFRAPVLGEGKIKRWLATKSVSG